MPWIGWRPPVRRSRRASRRCPRPAARGMPGGPRRESGSGGPRPRQTRRTAGRCREIPQDGPSGHELIISTRGHVCVVVRSGPKGGAIIARRGEGTCWNDSRRNLEAAPRACQRPRQNLHRRRRRGSSARAGGLPLRRQRHHAVGLRRRKCHLHLRSQLPDERHRQRRDQLHRLAGPRAHSRQCAGNVEAGAVHAGEHHHLDRGSRRRPAVVHPGADRFRSGSAASAVRTPRSRAAPAGRSR